VSPSHSYPDRTSLPPEWVDFADKARDDIREIKAQLVQLTKAQQRQLLKAPAAGEPPDQQVEGLSASIATLIRCCEQSIHQVRSYGQNTSGTTDPTLDVEFRENVQRSLATELQQLSKQCREAQKQYLTEVKMRSQQQPQVPAPEIELGGEDPGRGTLQTNAELDAMEERAAERSHHIAQIVESVNELHCIFKDLAGLVIEQGSILDRIDYNTEKIYKKSHDARGQMQKAVQKKKTSDARSAKCFFLWVGLDLAALLVLILKYIIKYGKWGVIVLTVIFLLIGGCAFSCYKKAGALGSIDWEKKIPKEVNPKELWKKIRPGPLNTVKAMRAAGSAGS
jgi:syntaxin 16